MQKDIILQLRQSVGQIPFLKAMKEIQRIFTSQDISPLDKLYKLQKLSIMNHFEINKAYYQGQVVLTQDEMISILSYIYIQSGIPDLVS